MVRLNDGRFWAGSDLNGRGHPEGLRFFWGIPNEERSEFIRLGQALLLEKIRDGLKDGMCPYALPGMAQLRKTRCIVGGETFTGEDGLRREIPSAPPEISDSPVSATKFPWEFFLTAGFRICWPRAGL